MATFTHYNASKDSNTSMWSCRDCGEEFLSRNRLFKHVGMKTCLKKAAEKEDLGQMGVTIYAVGGRNRGITLSSCERLVGGADHWEDVTALTSPRGSHGVGASADGRIFAMGGGGLETNLAVCEVLDTRTGLWTDTAPMSTFRHALACVTIGSHIYAIGGWVNGSVASADCERYDVMADHWLMMAPMPTPRRLLGAAASPEGGAIYVFGGSQEDEKAWYLTTAEQYIVSEDRWTTLRPLPAAGACSAATVDEYYVYVFIHGHGVVRYEVATDTYVSMGKLPLENWYSFDVKSVGKRSIVILGGAQKGKSSRAAFVFDVFEVSWTRLPDMGAGRRRVGMGLTMGL